jgi:hypothetical protein
MPEPMTQRAVKLISEVVADAGFPQSAVGETVDIKGYTGVVVEIVKNSLKVRSDEGITMSYNFNALRRLYGPRSEPTPPESSQKPESAPEPEPQPKREIILEPDFNLPLVPIEDVVGRPDFPKCTFGQHIDLHGYSGVVVELVGPSLKVRSSEGSTRSYNEGGLRKIYRSPMAGSSQPRG